MPEARENAMAIDQVDRTVVTQEPAVAGQQAVVTDSRRVTRAGPGGAEMIRRIIILVFGLIQLVIGARIVLLALDAREANVLVSAILNVSQVFVAPFEGILRTDSLHAAGSVLDITAIVALIGWTVVELVALWMVGIFRRERATGTV
jgi:YGGT family